jgi:hypothetical protein
MKHWCMVTKSNYIGISNRTEVDTVYSDFAYHTGLQTDAMLQSFLRKYFQLKWLQTR